MSDKPETQSTPDDFSQAFAKLWQDKWAEMLKQQGWPEHMALPGFGQMPMMMPFMPYFGGLPGENTALLQRIDALEKRIAKLEKNMPQRNTKRPKNMTP